MWMVGLVLASTLGFGLWGAPSLNEPQTILMDFSQSAEVELWRSIDDRVMGGISESRMTSSGQGSAIFSGTVSLENNGGFASVRSATKKRDWSGFAWIVLRVRGDGKTYSINLKTDPNFDGITYRSNFTTKRDEWTTVVLPMDGFRAVFRGRPVPQAGKIDWKEIQSVGFLISGRQEGEFRLEVESIQGRRPGAKEPALP